MDRDNLPLDITAWAEDQDQLDKILSELPQQYEILGKMSEGGMGSIFKARNRYTAACVAIKLMHFESTRNPDSIKRFYFEAKAASLLKHANICRLLDFGVTQSGWPYLIMDWIEGKSLDQVVLDKGRLSITEAILIFKQVSAALGQAHKNKIVHRDLKPENIMLAQNQDGDFEAQIVDFGIAKLIGNDNSTNVSKGPTKVGFTVGSPRYMSPEQVSGEDLDNRSDLYSLGCVMYFALTGCPPFAGLTVVETLKKHILEPVPIFDSNLKIPVALQNIIFKTLEKKPGDRFLNADELILELDRLISPKLSVDQTNDMLSQVLPELIELRQIKKSLNKQSVLSTKKFSAVVWFVLSFIVVYVISILLQQLEEAPGSHVSKSQVLDRNNDNGQ
jgi:eukaryotic-like serine/threonine-protein kinase